METNVHENANYGTTRLDAVKKLSWGSIWAGTLIGIVTMILLNMLGLGIGFSAIDIAEEQNPAKGFGTASIIWYVVSNLTALFVAGWVTGRLAQTRRLFDGALHGVLTWSVITLASIYFLTTTIGNVLGGAGRLVTGTISTVAKGSEKIVDIAAPAVQKQLGNMDFSEMKSNGTPDQVINLFKNANGDPAKVDRNELANIIMAESDKTKLEAIVTADSLITEYKVAATKFKENKEEMIVQAKETGDDIADGAATAFIIAFFAFLLGALAAGFGAKLGTESKSNVHYVREDHQSVH